MHRFQGFAKRLSGFTALACLIGCGGASGNLGMLADAEKSRYAGTCKQQTEKQQAELASGVYYPAMVFTHRWPGGGSDKSLPESRLAAALDAGEVKRLVIQARGGLGKTRLGESLRGQLCGVMPTFLIDLKVIAAAKAPSTGVGPLITAMASDAAVIDPLFLVQDLAERRFLLLLDAIEEVDLPRRAIVMAEIAKLVKQFPLAQIALLERPPVLDADYGFHDADAVVEIPPLECKVAEAVVARSYPSLPERKRFEEFLKRYALDEKGHFGLQCVYPYMSTFRDVMTLAEFEKQSLAPDAAVRVSTAAVYEALVGARLGKEFTYLSWTNAEALDMVDRLMRVLTSAQGQHTLVFDLEACSKALDAKWGTTAVDAGVSGNDVQRRLQVCEKLFQSALFHRTEGASSWSFADRSSSDLFMARWLGGEIARTPTGDCTIIGRHAEVLGSAGVLRFFAGQPYGQRCLGHAIAAACGKGDVTNTVVDTLSGGLPSGPARAQALQDARAAVSGLDQKTCTGAVLDALDKTIAP